MNGRQDGRMPSDLELYRDYLAEVVKHLVEFEAGFSDFEYGMEDLIEERCKRQGRESVGMDYHLKAKCSFLQILMDEIIAESTKLLSDTTSPEACALAAAATV